MEIRLNGTIGKGIRWATDNWLRMKKAHSPLLDEFHPGTLNIHLPEEWEPPNDQQYFEQARANGAMRRSCGFTYDDGVDFVECGNYVHPTIRVVSIAGLLINGLVYYPGAPLAQASKPMRMRIEVLAKTGIRKALGIGDKDLPVLAVLEMSD